MLSDIILYVLPCRRSLTSTVVQNIPSVRYSIIEGVPFAVMVTKG
jgi:hypothetical protein